MSDVERQKDRYLDAASGLPLSPAGRQALAPAWDSAWPDPSRRYASARQSRRLLDAARSSVANELGVGAAGVFFLPDIDTAITTALFGFPTHRLLVSAVEDTAILRATDERQRWGATVTPVPVTGSGVVAATAVGQAAHPSDPALLVAQDVNIEIGSRQPLSELGTLLPAQSLVLADGRASVGRDAVADSWDLLLADPRMWGGPPGCAVLAVREPQHFHPQTPWLGGFADIEPPNPAVPLIAAAALALEQRAEDRANTAAISDYLRSTVPESIPDCEVVGVPTSSFITMFTFLYVAADELIDELARRGWSCASGASCTSDTQRPHHVLTAVGASSHGSLRVSLPPWIRQQTAEDFVAELAEIVTMLRREAGAAEL